MFPHLKKLSIATSIAAAASLLAACDGGSSSAGTGSARVYLTDAPACGYDAVNVTVKKIRVHQSASAGENDAGWTDITLNPARKINLLNLTNGVLEELGTTPLPAGEYTQLRLVLDTNSGNAMANTVIPTGSTNEIAMETPSGAQSGLKLGHRFSVRSGERVDLVLDFDACKSVVTKGNGGYALKPVITVIPTVLNGIQGYVNTGLLQQNVMITAQQNGRIIRATVPKADGEFYLARLEPGNYDVVFTANDRVPAVIATVPVATATSTVQVSTIGIPVSLQTASAPERTISGTVSLNPASSTEVAYVEAKQSFAAGPTVTMKYQGANLTTGAYTLSNLPTVAPQLGTYSTSLPISFTTQNNTNPGTGKYAVTASANGYASKTVSPVDLSSANQTGVNFNLQP